MVLLKQINMTKQARLVPKRVTDVQFVQRVTSPHQSLNPHPEVGVEKNPLLAAQLDIDV